MENNVNIDMPLTYSDELVAPLRRLLTPRKIKLLQTNVKFEKYFSFLMTVSCKTG